MKFGDRVIFIENGEEFNATVLSSRVLDHHTGENDEPLLSLAFFKPVMAPGPQGFPVEKNVIGTAQQGDLVQFRHDVAHVSHEYSEEYLKEYNGGRPMTYAGGRWTEETFPGIKVPLPSLSNDATSTSNVETSNNPVAAGKEEPKNPENPESTALDDSTSKGPVN